MEQTSGEGYPANSIVLLLTVIGQAQSNNSFSQTDHSQVVKSLQPKTEKQTEGCVGIMFTLVNISFNII